MSLDLIAVCLSLYLDLTAHFAVMFCSIRESFISITVHVIDELPGRGILLNTS